MKAKKAGRLLRKRALWVAEHAETNRMCMLTKGVCRLDENKLVRLKGRIASVEEHLRQNGYGHEVDHE